MAMKLYSIFPKAPDLESHHQSVICRHSLVISYPSAGDQPTGLLEKCKARLTDKRWCNCHLSLTLAFSLSPPLPSQSFLVQLSSLSSSRHADNTHALKSSSSISMIHKFFEFFRRHQVSAQIRSKFCFVLIYFYSISTILNHLMPNPFYSYKQFFFKQVSLE